MRRKREPRHRLRPSAAHAGNTCRRSTLFGEMGLPDHVENTNASVGLLVPSSPIRHQLHRGSRQWNLSSLRCLRACRTRPRTPPPAPSNTGSCSSRSLQRSANSSPRRTPDSSASPAIVLANGGSARATVPLGDRQRPFRSDGFQRRHVHVSCGIVLEVAPLDCGAQDALKTSWM